ncbi:formate dehydrogenase subunit gamma [Malaciobacter marinus]|uniref:Formate dehydrogenase N, cytochrome b-556 subunit n=1 Tax=Malaciobacter marinus TaxID=505249 RepID=A0A347TM89_9BACT|nr:MULTISPECIES: formate dehydrogenase subunit gamma [Malaciobacter]AXX87711.1 formate dehydrogenase N, cytochrome b-556 subunit [Malaciobacter marinus]AXX87717.1 formate dehydrogenase N, cytochrome b-556 subunit [Malaciobacter marinus]PHO12341.1 formate dehydrogenase subunit gamma [Malaciobacter marinus]PHO14140.1 formate dehydrogenase subunit gamma [Malaciobacter marinus]RYA24964.1 formate dehydrogenase subunit gamma [Malaciobacter halophilus]
MRFKYIILILISLASLAFASESAIFGKDLIPNILAYDKEGSLHLGKWFTLLQSTYFKPIFLGVLLGVPAVFFIHYKIIGPMIFSHDRKKIYVFSVFNRAIHTIAAISFMLLIPTGVVMVFGDFFGGGEFVRINKDIHAISTLLFVISVIPMLMMWFKEMLPTSDDIKWLMILGGYLNKRKDPIPAGKFNAGQKMWFYVCTFGGIIMIATGAIMFFQDFKFDFIASLGLSQIDLLRASAIVHNILGFAVLALFMTHIYMSVFAIKGAIHSILTGYKEEEEVEILHSSFYKKLNKDKKI